MPGKLVTLARFPDPIEASLARNRLDEAGIKSILNNEEASLLGWQSASTGTVELLVNEGDVETAREALLYHDPGLKDRQWLMASHPEGIVESQANSQHREGITTPDMVEEDGPPVDPQQERINRACRATLVGLVCWPLAFYAFYLLFNLLTEERPIPSEKKPLLWLALFASGFVCAFLLFLSSWIIGWGL